jgi:hypothetical protein
MVVSGRLRRALAPEADSYRSMKLFVRSSYEAEEVDVSGAYSERMRRGEQGEWEFSEGSSAPEGKEAAPLADTLLNLTGIEAVSAADPEALGLTPPYLSIAMKGEDFEERVAVGAERDGRRWARPAGRPVALLLDPEEWARAEAALKAVPLAPEPPPKEDQPAEPPPEP